MAVPRVVDGIRGTVVSMAGGFCHSLVTTAEGCVLAFGCNGEENYEDSDGEELDEPIIDVDGRLGLGAGVEKALTPTTIDGIALDAGPRRIEELDRLIEEHGPKKEDAAARYKTETEEAAARYKAETEEAAARYAESLRCLEEDLDQHKAEKAVLEKKAADNAMEGKEGKECKE